MYLVFEYKVHFLYTKVPEYILAFSQNISFIMYSQVHILFNVPTKECLYYLHVTVKQLNSLLKLITMLLRLSMLI